MREYIVWVGGVIVNSYKLTFDKAEDLVDEYIADGYDDAVLEKI